MNFENPWESISIELIQENKKFNFYDTNINILYVLSGNATFLYESKSLILGCDDFIIIPKAKESQLILNDAKVFLCKFVYIISMDKLKKYNYVFEGDSVINGSSKSIALIKVLKNIIQSYIFKDERPRFKIFQYYFEILSLLEESFCKKENIMSFDSIYSKVKALTSYILMNCESEIKLSELAKQLYVSEQYLSRMFKKVNGESLLDFIINCRLEKVTNQLINTEKTITDIAFSTGFTNINSFNRIFKNKYNMTPKEFRNLKSNKFKFNEETEKDFNMDSIKELFIKSNVLDSSIKINLENDKFIKRKLNYFIIGLGSIGKLNDQVVFLQINKLKSLKFNYARINGWFDKEIMFSEGNYDFFKIDLVIKKLLTLGIKPYIEINIYDYLVNNVRILENIKILFKHFIDVYGSIEVGNWIVDIIYNECKSNEYKYINQLESNIYTEYFKIFISLKKIIKEISNDIKIGGGGLRIDYSCESFIDNFYKQIKNFDVFPEFLSISLFQYEKKNNKEIDEKISPDPNFIKRKIVQLKKYLKEVGFNIDIIIKEFNITFSKTDIINDTAFISEFIVKNIIDIMDDISFIGYGNLSDYLLRDEKYFQKEIFGGNGMFSINGLPKGGYFAFLFLMNTLLNNIYKEGDFLISKNNDNSEIKVLAFNYFHLGINYYYKSYSFHKYNIYTAFDNVKESIYSINLEGIINKNKNYKVTINRFGEKNGNILDEINRYTKDDILLGEDIEYLEGVVKPIRNIQYLSGDSEKYSIDIKMNQHEIIYVSIVQI